MSYPKQKYLQSMARIEGPYRYWLERAWDLTLPTMVFIMLNPSTADGTIDDQTIRRCCYFAQREGCGRIIVVNLYAWRATQPSDLWEAERAGSPIRGHDNRVAVLEAMAIAEDGDGIVVAAWGVNAPVEAINWLFNIRKGWGSEWPQLQCLGYTRDGLPRHPSRLPNDAPLLPWPDPARLAEK